MWKPPETSWSKKEVFGFAALLTALFIWTLAPLQGFDFWYYLAVGRYMVEHHSIPWSESFLGTSSSLAFHRYGDQVWLTSLVFYGFYSAGGILGLVFSRSLLLCAISAVTYVNCRLLGASPWFAGLWTALGLWTVRSRFLLRSYHFSDLGLAVAVFFLIRYHDRPKARLIGLACTFFLWCNFHQGVIVGWVLVFLWALFGGTSRVDGFKTLLVVFVAGLLRPHGHLFFSFLQDTFGNRAAMEGVLEWTPMTPVQIGELLGPFLTMTTILILLQAYRGKIGRSLPWHFLIVAIAFLVLAVRSQRAVGELLPVAFPLVIPFFPVLPWSKIKFTVGTFFVGGLMLYTNPLQPWNKLDQLYPLYPVQLEKSVANLPGQVLNSYEYGNFLAFKGIPPFIHGITALYKEQLILDFQTILSSPDKREALIDRWGVQTFLLHFPTGEDSTGSLLDALYADPNWKMVTWDDSGFVFTRGPAAEGLVAVKPWLPDVRWRDPSAAKTELEMLVEKTPSAMAHILLTQLASEEGDWETVIRHAEAAIELVPHSSRAWQVLAFASNQTGDLPTALRATKEAVRWEPDNPQVQFNRAFILFKAHPDLSGFQGWLVKREIRQHLHETLRLSPENRAARQLLDELS